MRSGDEFREIFNLKYNNINSGIAPGLNDYEISLFLTEAQKEVIENFYSGTTKGYTFEQLEKIRKNLSVITKEDYKSNPNIGTPESLRFQKFNRWKINLDTMSEGKVWRVLHEYAYLKVPEGDCMYDTAINIKPVRHNELNKILQNPFRQPSRYTVLRLDIDGSHELISKETLRTYHYRYIEFPYPIILIDLKDSAFRIANGLPEDEEYPLRIEGKFAPVDINNICVFDSYMEDIIIDRAVELATVGYKENSLQTQLITNLRKE